MLPGIISYPRTETTAFGKTIDLNALVQKQTESLIWGEFARKVIVDGVNPKRGKKEDEAHPPIHPLKVTKKCFFYKF